MKIVISDNSSFNEEDVENIDTEKDFEPLEMLAYLATFPAVIRRIDYDKGVVIIDHPYAY